MTDAETPDLLTLEVREALMRGQHETAVELLMQSQGINKEQAEQCIADYKLALKERNLMLNVQVMQEQQANENKRRQQPIILWSVRIAAVITVLLLFFLLTTGVRS